MKCQFKSLVIVLVLLTFSACGGGGGGGGKDDGGRTSVGSTSSGGTTGTQAGTSSATASALNFDEPDSFLNGRSYTTARQSIAIKGELNSVTIPRGHCPGSPPQNHTVRWTNQTTGQTATVNVYIGCVTNTLFGTTSDGVTSVFQTEEIGLSLGTNQILFETFESGRKAGEDAVLIVREDRTTPVVMYRYPGAGIVDVPQDHSVLAVFSEAMAPTSLTAAHFQLHDQNDNPVHGQLTYNPDHFSWRLQPDTPMTTGVRYTVMISPEVEDSAGNSLTEPVSWSFVAGSDPDQSSPVLRDRWPGGSCDCASTQTRILARFEEPILPRSVEPQSLRVLDRFEQPMSGTTIYAGDYLEFVPDSELLPGEVYTVRADAGLQDMVGNTMGQVPDWQFRTDDRMPVGYWENMAEDAQIPAMSGHTAVWADPEVIFWNGSEGAAYHVGQDTWMKLPITDAPSPRIGHSGVWTGSEMFIWGGRADGEALASGASYHPGSNLWTPVTPPTDPAYQARHGHIAVWTGYAILIWGGDTEGARGAEPQLISQGWRYDPLLDTWSVMSNVDAPAPRMDSVVAWTGTELLIWGGRDAEGNLLDDGARYNPQSDTWSPISGSSAPVAHGHPQTGQWLGSELAVWNGGALQPEQRSNTGYRQPTLRFYDPVTDSWRMSSSGWEPLLITRSIYDEPLAVSLHWSGTRLIAIGGWSFAGIWAYDPLADSWEVLNRHGGRFGYRGEAEVWTGDRLVRWGGVNNVLPTSSGKVFIP